MGSGWFNLVLTLCAVRGFGRTMGDMKKPSSRGRAWLRGIVKIGGDSGDRLFYRLLTVAQVGLTGPI